MATEMATATTVAVALACSIIAIILVHDTYGPVVMTAAVAGGDSGSSGGHRW